MKIYFVYMTARDKKEARRIGRELVKSRLAACVNILADMNSLYEWKGTIRDDHEAVLIAKTRADRVKPLIKKIKTLHSYDCPCVVAWPIALGHPAFLAWVSRESKDQRSEIRSQPKRKRK